MPPGSNETAIYLILKGTHHSGVQSTGTLLKKVLNDKGYRVKGPSILPRRKAEKGRSGFCCVVRVANPDEDIAGIMSGMRLSQDIDVEIDKGGSSYGFSSKNG